MAGLDPAIHAISLATNTGAEAGTRHDHPIAEIPDDPYDIPAGLARTLMGHYEVDLTSAAFPESN
jgi:hypothetical protein